MKWPEKSPDIMAKYYSEIYERKQCSIKAMKASNGIVARKCAPRNAIYLENKINGEKAMKSRNDQAAGNGALHLLCVKLHEKSG